MPGMLPSPAVSVIGRHNSGKTTLVEKVIAQLCEWGYDVGSVKHHGRSGFQMDIPGKDSYRHREAGASETWIVAPGKIAMVKTVEGDSECSQIVSRMPGHDVVIVEGYRLSGLPAIEVMRSGNERDAVVAQAFYDASVKGVPLSCDILQSTKGSMPKVLSEAGEAAETGCSHAYDPLASKLPGSRTVAIVSDIPLAREAAGNYGIPSFDIDDILGVASFICDRYVRPRLTVAIQAGGESRRMGQSKATVPFLGRPLITRIVERLQSVADELVITTNEPERLGFLNDAFPGLRIRLVPDECSFRGALPGLLTALRASSSPYVAVVACDMVFASAELVAREFSLIQSESADICIPVSDDGVEPFHALYRREPCLEVCERAVAQGNMRPRVLLDECKVAGLDRQAIKCADPEGNCLVNANTPEELTAAEELVQLRPDLL